MAKVHQTVEEKAARGQTIVTQGPADRSSETRDGNEEGVFVSRKPEGDGTLERSIRGNKVPQY